MISTRGVSPAQPESKAERQGKTCDHGREKRADEFTGNTYLIDCSHDGEGPHRAACDRGQQVWIAEIGVRRACADDAMGAVGDKAADHENGQRDHKTRQPHDELPKRIGNGRQSQRIEGDHQCNQPNEPLGDQGDEADGIGIDPGIVDEPRKPDRCAMSLKRTRRRIAATPRATSEAMNQPIARMIKAPMIAGIDASSNDKAFVKDVWIAAPHVVNCSGMSITPVLWSADRAASGELRTHALNFRS